MALERIKIEVSDYYDHTRGPHFNIDYDGVIRYSEKIEADDTVETIWVKSDEHGNVSDAQCQAVVSLTLASQMTYVIPSKALEVRGFTWEELLRRG